MLGESGIQFQLGVGKSCLLFRFSDNKYRDDIGTTLGVEFR